MPRNYNSRIIIKFCKLFLLIVFTYLVVNWNPSLEISVEEGKKLEHSNKLSPNFHVSFGILADHPSTKILSIPIERWKSSTESYVDSSIELTEKPRFRILKGNSSPFPEHDFADDSFVKKENIIKLLRATTKQIDKLTTLKERQKRFSDQLQSVFKKEQNRTHNQPDHAHERFIVGTAQQTDKIEELFQLWEDTASRCRKLATLGGELECNTTKDIPLSIDGDKKVCFDPEFQLPPQRPRGKCLLLSFGVHWDTSFDEAMVDLGCRVHMFDLGYYPHNLEGNELVQFHQVGLDTKKMVYFFGGVNKTAKVNSLENLLVELNLTGDLIHMLKLDIESFEWDVLNDLADKPFLNQIGQIAVEFHLGRMTTFLTRRAKEEKERQQLAAYYIETIRKLERRGFARTWRQGNFIGNTFDHKGQTYVAAAEFLFINTNWSKRNFRRKLQIKGFDIKVDA